MTRLLTLVLLGLAIALAPTPGEAQTRVPDHVYLLDQDQTGDFYLSRRDFLDNAGGANLRQYTRACIDQIRSNPYYNNLPNEVKNNLNTLYNLASGGTNGRVVALGAECARNDFRRRYPDFVFEPRGSAC